MRKWLVFSILVVFAAATAGAVEIWAVDNLGTTNGGTVGDRVIKFDSATPGAVTVVGATQIASTLMGGLDFGGSTLYAYGQTGAMGLYTINQATGHGTFIGGGGLQGGDSITDLSWDPTQGKLYGLGIFDTTTAPGIYTINTTTGAATLVGRVTGATGSLCVGLATDAAGTRYMHDLVLDGMYKLNGLAATFMGAEGFNANYSQGMTIDWAHDGTWYHGAFNAGSFRTELWTVSTANGAGTFKGYIGPVNPNGLPEYETGDIAIAPEPASLGLLALGLLALRRR